jgi:hypothetical protein
LKFLGWNSASGDRQRRGSRNEQKRGEERTGEHGGGLTGRSEIGEHGKTPLHLSVGPDHRAHAKYNARGVPIRKSRYFSVSAKQNQVKTAKADRRQLVKIPKFGR